MIIVVISFFAKKRRMEMKSWKHLTFEQKVIFNGISHNYKLKEIAEPLGFDPTSILKLYFSLKAAIFGIISDL